MGSMQDSIYGNEVLIRLTDEDLEILQRLRKERNMSFSELVHEALADLDGTPHVW